MDIMEKRAPDRGEKTPESRFGIPVVAVIGLPLLTVLVVLFLGFGLTLQGQRAELTNAYAKRTAEYLARDLAGQLGALITPLEQYADGLVKQIGSSGCKTSDCIFSIIKAERLTPDRVPAQFHFFVLVQLMVMSTGLSDRKSREDLWTDSFKQFKAIHHDFSS